jgi:hypothetical protein
MFEMSEEAIIQIIGMICVTIIIVRVVNAVWRK